MNDNEFMEKIINDYINGPTLNYYYYLYQSKIYISALEELAKLHPEAPINNKLIDKASYIMNIIQYMTEKERDEPSNISAIRIREIANLSKTTELEIHLFIDDFLITQIIIKDKVQSAMGKPKQRK